MSALEAQTAFISAGLGSTLTGAELVMTLRPPRTEDVVTMAAPDQGAGQLHVSTAGRALNTRAALPSPTLRRLCRLAGTPEGPLPERGKAGASPTSSTTSAIESRRPDERLIRRSQGLQISLDAAKTKLRRQTACPALNT
jgi:hypothetical protein